MSSGSLLEKSTGVEERNWKDPEVLLMENNSAQSVNTVGFIDDENIEDGRSSTSWSGSLEEDIEVYQEEDPLLEIKRLQMHQELLENKVSNLEQKLLVPRVKKSLRDSYRLQIANAERKQEMLARKIAYEKRQNNLSGRKLGNKSQSLSQVDEKLFYTNYTNTVNNKDILARMALQKQSLKLKNEELKVRKSCKDFQPWGIWRKLDGEKGEENIDTNRYIIRRPVCTTVFFPPIPSPFAKKRPRDALPWYDRESTKLGESSTETSRKREVNLRLIPNSKRVAKNRATMYTKQLEFAEKYDLDTKDINENLSENVEFLKKKAEDNSLSCMQVTRQQLYLMGALSREYVSEGNDVRK